MKRLNYISDQWIRFLLDGIFMVFFICLMAVYHVASGLIIVSCVFFILIIMVVMIWDYKRKSSFYNELDKKLEILDQKYLILDMIEEPYFFEGKLLVEKLYEINKSMTERVKDYSKNISDYKDFVEMWVHEVKLPIASLTLMVHNMINDSSKMDDEEMRDEYLRKVLSQLTRLDNYSELILYFIRSEYSQNDYQFTKNKLKTVVGAVAIKNKDLILENDINLNIHDLDYEVYTDNKWMEFIINQIISNSIKYKKDTGESEIEIYATEDERSTTLHIRDNGIGISKADIPRVFDKTFTGENGRKFAKSTGMGLYIVKGLIDKMGHKIEIESEVMEYTEIKISFGKNNMYDVVRNE
ncbi:MAG: sensor histidine kinase [Eubacterium sp.]|nr:sensor histidine kinase [Eubacterium sp.]